VPANFWDETSGQVRAKEFTAFLGLAEAQAARIAARPEKPDGYALEFPKEFKPEIPLTFDDKDPRLAELRNFAHEQGWDQGTFSKVLQIEAARHIAEHKAMTAAIAARDKALGPNAAARITAAQTWLESVLGKDRGAAVIDRMVLHTDVEALEDLQKAFTTQGAASFNNNGRDRQVPQTEEIPGYDNMSFEQRRAAQWNRANGQNR